MLEPKVEELDKFNEYISEKDLYEIFEIQYDDLFCKILKISEKSFTYFLKQQILFNLEIIKRKVSSEIISAYLDLFIKRYKENLKIVRKNVEIIKEKEKANDNDLTYLDITKCYIHCNKCFNIIHKCGKKLVLYEDYIYCTKCNNVYNKNQIMIYCPGCNKNYLSKLRKPVFNENKKYEKLFLLKFKKYHCETNKEEKMKCLKCSNNLYFRLSQNNSKNEDNINVIYCIKCKLKYNIKDVFFKCKICLKYFKSEAKLYRDFPSKKKKLLFLIHTLLRNKNALPNSKFCQKACGCELTKETEYFHNEDKGKFLEGIKNKKISVVCGKCFKKFKIDEVNWNCPKCGKEFIHNNKNANNNIIQSDNNSTDLGEEIDNLKELRKIPVFKVNLGKINKNENKSPNNKENKENGAKKDENQIKNENNKNIKTIVNKKIDKKYSINFASNRKIPKNIFINKKEFKGNIIETKNLLRKSRSKNDIITKKNKNNKNIIKSNNINKNKIINISKLKEKSNHENNKKDEMYQKEKNGNEQIINKEKELNVENKEEEKKGKKLNKEEKELKKEDLKKEEKEGKKEEIKDIDTTEIFNKIKDNIYNDEESFNLFSPKIKKRINERNKLNLEQMENSQINPKHKNTQYLGNNEFNINNMYEDKNFYGNDELIEEPKINNIYYKSSKKVQSTQNFIDFDNINLENSNKKHIKYTKKIYFYNGKKEDKINLNTNKQLQNNVIKPTRNDYFDKKGELNLYENNNELPYSIDQSFQNYDNYYIDYQNYKDYPSFNLYNFSSENYSTIRLLGKGANGKIYLVTDMQTNQNYALKTILVDNEFQLKGKEEEYNLVYALTYENPELKIINIYGLEVRRMDKFNIFFNVLMEAAICDWEMEIMSRKKINNYYTEEELLYILTNLVGTLAYLQQKNITHRDLKPQNILYFGNNEYKICDFGEAKLNRDKKDKLGGKESNLNFDDSKQTIRGTELYMSPILFKAVKFKPNSLTTYNSFKSDVFSLGLCFLHASSLDTNIIYKIREILDMQKIIKIVNDYLGRRYSQNYINLLLYMIQIDEKFRPDFIELNSWLLYGNN